MSKQGTYATLESEYLAVLEGGVPRETALVSLIALLKERFSAISWVGFYRHYGEGHLWAGPYQGKLACTFIPPGKGVCGAAFAERKTLIVPDVEKFPGHIACDALSRSEIVVPVWRGAECAGECEGVLDLDSHALAAFDAVDAERLERLIKKLPLNQEASAIMRDPMD